VRLLRCALVAFVSACSSEVGISMQLDYDPAACGGCAATEASLPTASNLALAFADADSDEVLESRCFSLNVAATIAALPDRFRDSEFNDIALPGDRVLVATLKAFGSDDGCGAVGDVPLLEATSAPVDVGGGARTFVLTVDCPASICPL
jgi:hypothetical protein